MNAGSSCLFGIGLSLSPRQLGDKRVELCLILAQLVPAHLEVLELTQVVG